MTAPVSVVPKWQLEVLSWLHALAVGGLSALASALDVASSNHVMSVKTIAHAVVIGALARGVGWLITRLGP